MKLEYRRQKSYLMGSWTSKVEIQGNKHLRYNEDRWGRLYRSIPPANSKERVVTTWPTTTDIFMDHLPGTILRT